MKPTALNDMHRNTRFGKSYKSRSFYHYEDVASRNIVILVNSIFGISKETYCHEHELNSGACMWTAWVNVHKCGRNALITLGVLIVSEEIP